VGFVTSAADRVGAAISPTRPRASSTTAIAKFRIGNFSFLRGQALAGAPKRHTGERTWRTFPPRQSRAHCPPATALPARGEPPLAFKQSLRTLPDDRDTRKSRRMPWVTFKQSFPTLD